MGGSLGDAGRGATSSATAPRVARDLPCLRQPELFFAESPRDVERAKALCGTCGDRVACLAGALGREEPWGVWGGELLLQGAIVPFKRPRGRPRKEAAGSGRRCLAWA
jgi:WhiB family transcriptional regulator, redox-sensing transcriptional regulator